MGVARVPFWAGAQVNPNQTAVPASPSRTGRPVDLWGQRVVPGFLSRPPIPRIRVSLSVGPLLYRVFLDMRASLGQNSKFVAIFVCRYKFFTFLANLTIFLLLFWQLVENGHTSWFQENEQTSTFSGNKNGVR